MILQTNYTRSSAMNNAKNGNNLENFVVKRLGSKYPVASPATPKITTASIAKIMQILSEEVLC